MKSFALVTGIAAALFAALPARAQDVDPTIMLARVCLPYAGRSASFERAIDRARELRFGRPANSPPLEDYSSDVEMVSSDGIWRIRLEEGTITSRGREAYALTCSLSSKRASATELGRLIDRALSGNPRWTTGGEGARWQRQSSDDTRTVIDVKEPEGQRPALRVTGLYF